jgi:folate-binding protein YgfZ
MGSDPRPRLLDRAVIRLSPIEESEDVRGFLQGLVTQDTSASFPLWAALLTPQGKVLFDFFLWADLSTSCSTDVLIDCEATQADALVKRLSIYRLRRKISIEVDKNVGVWWEPDSRNDGWPDPRLAALGHRGLCLSAAEVPDGSAEFRKRRLSLGVTEGIAELGNGETLWLECNAAELNGVSFNKGCYVGQENTARMNWRQKVNRRLLVVPIAEADPKRLRIAYPELGLAVVHARVEDVLPEQWPTWLSPVQD